MKAYIQDVGTLKFVKDLDSWTDSEEEALAFQNTRSALKYCVKHNLGGVVIRLQFKDGSSVNRLEVPADPQGRVLDRSGRFFAARELRYAA